MERRDCVCVCVLVVSAHPMVIHTCEKEGGGVTLSVHSCVCLLLHAKTIASFEATMK